MVKCTTQKVKYKDILTLNLIYQQNWCELNSTLPLKIIFTNQTCNAHHSLLLNKGCFY